VIPRTADLHFEGRPATAPFSLRLDDVTVAAGKWWLSAATALPIRFIVVYTAIGPCNRLIARKRPLRSSDSTKAWRTASRNVRLPRLHPLLQEDQGRKVHREA
jgi:hypothetical protein